MSRESVRHILFAAASVAIGSITASAATWDGGAGDNLWNSANSWDPDGVPTAAAAVLGDVPTGTRTVTLSGAAASSTTLSLTQTTAGATNALVIDGTTLSLTSTSSTSLSASQASGTVTISAVNGGTLRYFVNSNTAKTFTNPGTFTLGSSDGAGSSGNFLVQSDGAVSNQGPAMNYTNNGTTSLFNASSMGINSGSMANGSSVLSLTNAGTLNLAGATATGIRMGVINFGAGSNTPTLTNNASATVNVTRSPNAASGVGLTTFGFLKTSSNHRASAQVTNNGTFNIAADASFAVQARRNRTESHLARMTNAADATLSIGDASSTTAQGTLAFQITDAGGTVTNLNNGLVFDNSGTANLYGTSRIIAGASSSSVADGNKLVITNNAAGVINLYDTSALGSSARPTVLTNAGTLNKLDAGTATVAVGASGSATNTGTLYIKAGALDLTGALDTSAGTIKFDLGAADVNDAMLLTQQITLGSASVLALNFTASDLGSFRSYNLYEGAASGTIESVQLSGSGFSGTYASAPTTWSSNNYDFTLDHATGVLTATLVPEPSALLGLAMLPLVARRRRI
jgi:hypothetical protein